MTNVLIEFNRLVFLSETIKMDSLGGVQLIKADGSSHAAEAALDGKVGCIEERPNTTNCGCYDKMRT